MKGIYTALVTPFLKNKKIDYKALKYLLSVGECSEISGIVVLGSTGEEKLLSADEKINIVKTACKYLKTKEIYVGIAEVSAKNAIFEMKKYESMNVCGFLVSPPYYVKPNQGAVEKFYLEVAASTTKSICVYNIPSRTGTLINIETVLKLASIENIVAIKDAVGDLSYSKKLIKMVPKGFSVLCGNDNLFFQMKKIGAIGGVCVFSNFIPNYFCCDKKKNKNINKIFEFVNANSNPAGIKSVLGYFGIINNVLREPLVNIECKLLINYDNLLKNVYMKPKCTQIMVKNAKTTQNFVKIH